MTPVWQLPLIAGFCERVAKEGKRLSSKELQDLLDRLIAEDVSRETGFWKLRNYTPRSKEALLKRITARLERLEAEKAIRWQQCARRKLSVVLGVQEGFDKASFSSHIAEKDVLCSLEGWKEHQAWCHEVLLDTCLSTSDLVALLAKFPNVASVATRPQRMFGKYYLVSKQ